MFTNPYGSLVIQTSFVCPLLFILSNYLLKYSILEPNKTQCSVCLKFIHRNTISRHMKNLHGDSPRVQCQHCEKICKNLTSYKDHLRRDHSIYQSNWCQLRKNSNKNTWERTTASSSPIESQVTFSGVWQQGKIQCSYCDKAFHKDSLNRHVKNIHGPAQSFQCQYCQKNFKNSDSLQDHQSRVCKYVPGKRHSEYANWNKDQSLSLLWPYLCLLGDRAQCKFCGKWLHKRGLKRHVKDVHENEGDASESEHQCHLCERRFKTEQYLKNHLRVSHSIYQQQQQSMFWTFYSVVGEKQRCELCGKFVHPRALKRHIQLAHSTSQEASQCHLCQAVVKSAMYLKDHLRRKHNVYQSWE